MKIYLASPYLHKKIAIRQLRYTTACRIAAHLIEQGHIVYSPIAHSHGIAIHGDLPKDYGYWQDIDEEFISWSDEMWVATIDGWQDSNGIAREIEYCQKTDHPLRYFDWEERWNQDRS